MRVGRVILVGAGPGDPDLITVRGAQRLAVVEHLPPRRTVPRVDVGGSALGGLVAVTVGACVRRAECHAEIRARYAKAVVAPRVHAHVGGLWHVAVGAGAAAGPLGVMVVIRRVVGIRGVALGADGVARCPHLKAMGFVAIAADNARLVHLALHEGAVDIDLVEDLAIVVVQGGSKH